jgi:DNA-binding beta-propeller fold protein YncE
MRKWAGRVISAATGLLLGALLAFPSAASATFTPLGTWSTTFYSPDAIALVPSASGAAQDVWITEDTGDTPGEDAQELTPTGTFVREIETAFDCQGTSEDLVYPDGVAVDPATGDVFVDDSGDRRVIEFNSSGTFIAQIGGGEVSTTCGTPMSPDTAGSGPGYFDSGTGLSVGNGQLFVAQPGPDCGPTGNDFIDESPIPLTESHLQTAEIGSDGAFGQALYDPATSDIYAADSAPNSIDVYNSAGTFLTTWSSTFDGGNFAGCSPQWIAIDPAAGVLYAVDTGNDAIDTFNIATGTFLQRLAGLDSPQGIAIDPVNHVLYIVEDGATDTVTRYSYTPAPTCEAVPTQTAPSTAVGSLLSCVDAAGQPVTMTLESQPADGTISGFDPYTGRYTYTPNSGYAGTDSFTYDAASVDGTSQTYTASVTVEPGPACAPEAVSTSANATLAVTLDCSGNSSTATAYRIVSGPAHGIVSTPSSAGALTYTPTAGYTGTDSFTYEGLAANGGVSRPQTVTVYVGTPLPPPVEHQSANVVYSSGTVTILLPGQTTPIPLVAGMQVPLGSIVNTTGGRAEVIVANGQAVQHAIFYKGEFKLGQSANTRARRAGAARAKPVYAILDLLGAPIPKARCSHSGPATGTFALRIASASRARFHEKGSPVRQLWGAGHGDFTTVGNGSSSSVRGTGWAIFDYPDGTLTRVYKDSVAVYDFHTHRTVTVRAGHYFFAALAGLRRCG